MIQCYLEFMIYLDNSPFFFFLFPFFVLQFFLSTGLAPTLSQHPGRLLCVRCASCHLGCGRAWFWFYQRKTGVRSPWNFIQCKVVWIKFTFFLVSVLSVVLCLLLWGLHSGRHVVPPVRGQISFSGVASEMLINSINFGWPGFSGFIVEHILLHLQRQICDVVVILPHCGLLFGLFAVFCHLLVLCSPIVV